MDTKFKLLVSALFFRQFQIEIILGVEVESEMLDHLLSYEIRKICQSAMKMKVVVFVHFRMSAANRAINQRYQVPTSIILENWSSLIKLNQRKRKKLLHFFTLSIFWLIRFLSFEGVVWAKKHKIARENRLKSLSLSVVQLIEQLETCSPSNSQSFINPRLSKDLRNSSYVPTIFFLIFWRS